MAEEQAKGKGDIKIMSGKRSLHLSEESSQKFHLRKYTRKIGKADASLDLKEDIFDGHMYTAYVHSVIYDTQHLIGIVFLAKRCKG